MAWWRHWRLSIWQFSTLTLTHLPLDKMAAILQTTVSNTFSWMKKFDFWLKFHLSLFLWVQLTITQHMVLIMAWRRAGDKPLFESKMVRLLMHICITPPQWVNSLPPRSVLPNHPSLMGKIMLQISKNFHNLQARFSPAHQQINVKCQRTHSHLTEVVLPALPWHNDAQELNKVT